MSRSFKCYVWACAMLIASAPPVFGQLKISIESNRSTYLLYEPIVFSLSLTNTTGSPVALSENPVTKRPWLSFQIFRADGSKVMPVSGYSVPAEVLKPGESKILDVNITPLYRIRNTGPYEIRAVVTLAGRQQTFQTSKIRFVLGKGEEFWTQTRQVDGEKRHYSLIRFLERESSSLYLRVEAPQKNIVYATQRLGTVVGYTKPQVQFDGSGNLHILHVKTSQLYCYSKMGANGALFDQENRQVVGPGSVPRLVAREDGTIALAGGVDIQARPTRRRLSDDQTGF